MRLPNGYRADLGTKLHDYSLNPFHRDGRHKARVFASVLGVTRASCNILEQALSKAAANSDAAEFKGHNGFGDTYTLRLLVVTPVGRAEVFSTWIIRDGEDFPRLTTCFIV